VSSFNLKNFYKFASQLSIDSKEHGIKKLGTDLLGTQTYVMDEIASGLSEDIHHFVILKGRQQGITTVTLALDLYWHFLHAGLNGTLVTDTEENRDQFRSTLGMYMEYLPNEFKIPLLAHNRNQFVLKNRSRMFYQIAGTRAKGGLGRGKGITYLHSTETSSYGDDEGIASLMASLAEKNDNRLFVFESTARGYNLFHDMWATAKRARTQKAIFCGWWRNQLYSVEKSSDVYKTYWDGKNSPEENEWIREVKKLYDFVITPQQLAWWRWKMLEGIQDDSLMYQEFPPTEDYAFIMTGTGFFSQTRCTDAAKKAKSNPPDHYRFIMGESFENTTLVKSTDRLSTLKIWEEPVDKGYYVIGADPAYGSSDWADRFCIQVFRCYSDGIDQVAEFATSELNTYQFAWVICYLAGLYKNSTLDLEINGPGQAVINEMRNLKRLATSMGTKQGNDLYNVLGNMSNYIWRRNDSLTGPGMSIGYLTTKSTKERMLNYFKDYFERGMMGVMSIDLLDEMKSIVRDGGSIEAFGRGKDDRVIATGLACVAYAEQVQPRLVNAKMSRKISASLDNITPEVAAMNQNVTSYLKAIGVYGKGMQ
jgi:hypothetical protein